jgi:hypothetical protein
VTQKQKFVMPVKTGIQKLIFDGLEKGAAIPDVRRNDGATSIRCA